MEIEMRAHITRGISPKALQQAWVRPRCFEIIAKRKVEILATQSHKPSATALLVLSEPKPLLAQDQSHVEDARGRVLAKAAAGIVMENVATGPYQLERAKPLLASPP